MIELAFVGSVVPDTAAYRNVAFSRAGNMFQANLLAGLAGAGVPPSLVVSVRPCPAVPNSRRWWFGSGRDTLESGIEVELLPFLNVMLVKQAMLGVAAFLRLLRWGWKHRRAQARIVYLFNLSVPPAIFTLAAARWIGARAVASVNDINKPGATVPRTWRWRLDYWMQRRLLPRFDGLAVVSGAIIEDFAPHSRHVRVEGGITAEMAAGAERVESAGSAPFRVVFAGGMDAANGVEVMLQATALIEGDGYRFIFAGGGPLEESVRRAAERDPRIQCLGMLKLSELLPIYKQAGVLVNMRMTQAIHTRYFFPSKMMEFLASGTPVISTATGHVEEEFGEFTFVVKDETPEGLAAAIRRAEAAGNAARREMGNRARAYMLAHKTWAAQSARVAGLLETVAAGGGPWQ